MGEAESDRDTDHQAVDRGQWDHLIEAKASVAKQAFEVGAAALPTLLADHHHMQVEHRLWMRGLVRFKHALDQKQLRAWRSCAPDVGQDRSRSIVVPVVQDVLQEISVAARRQRFEEAARDLVHPTRDATTLEQLA